MQKNTGRTSLSDLLVISGSMRPGYKAGVMVWRLRANNDLPAVLKEQ